MTERARPASDSSSVSGSGRSTVSRPRSPPGRGRPARPRPDDARARPSRRSPNRPFHMSAIRPTSGRPTCSPAAPMQTRGGGSGSGGADGAVDAEVLAVERRLGLGPHQPADRDDLLELREAHRRRRELVAVGLVLVLAPAGADAEHEATRRTTPAASPPSWRSAPAGGSRDPSTWWHSCTSWARREPGERRPGLEERVGLGVEPVEVVGDPQRVEVRERGRQDVLVLVQRDRP